MRDTLCLALAVAGALALFFGAPMVAIFLGSAGLVVGLLFPSDAHLDARRRNGR